MERDKPKKKGRGPRPRKSLGSPTYYKDKVDAGNYSFKESEGWHYYEGNHQVYVSGKHLILCDKEGNDRFALMYEKFGSGKIIIVSIQRGRTQFKKTWGRKFKHSEKMETAKSKEFQDELGGMHPGEFLLSEFLHMYGEEIANGTEEVWYRRSFNPKMDRTVRPLVDKFFERRKGRGLTSFPLAMGKLRVKTILGSGKESRK